MSGPAAAPPGPLTVPQVRAVDRICLDDYGLPGVVLMENAGRGCAELLRDELLRDEASGAAGRVSIVCGRGNNGGDGFVIARHLAIAGADVTVFAPFAEPPTEQRDAGEAAMNARVVRRMGLPWHDWTAFDAAGWTARLVEPLRGGDWIVDALLGTGAGGPPRPPADAAVRAINAARDRGAGALAVDVPTGFDADAGEPFDTACCVRATHTASFVARKVGYDAAGAAAWTGAVRVVGIGAPPAAAERAVE